MKTVLITGGTDGIGKGLALRLLSEGCRVYVVSSNAEKGARLMAEAANPNLIFLQADLSLISENLRIASMLAKREDSLDALMLCAASLKPQASYQETSEGHEFTFALYYLSRYVLCRILKPMLDKAEAPVILNVAAPGMTGTLHLDDWQMKKQYDGQQAQFHGSRLNDLLGVWFTRNDSVGKIRYILFNPMAARTPGAEKMAGNNRFMKLYYKLAGKDVPEIVDIIMQNVEATRRPGLTAYKLSKAVNLKMKTFNPENAEKLIAYTEILTNSYLKEEN